MRCVVAAIALAAAISLPAQTRAQSWEEYRPDGIGFRIEMPGKPKLETKKTPGGSMAYHATVALKDMAFLSIYGTRDDKKVADLDALLDSAMKGMAEGKTLLSSKKENMSGYPARRFVLEDADKDRFEVRIVLADNRLIQAIFIGPVGSPAGRRFLDSFVIVESRQ